MKFIVDYDTSLLNTADYNPRSIDKSRFEELKASIQKYGIVKPLILNGDTCTLTAGHQRTKAIKELGIKTAPVIVINTVSQKDEIKFNLMHNSIETNKSNVYIKKICDISNGYSLINCDDILYNENSNAAIVKEICNMITKHGAWGSVIINKYGKVIHNSDYAVACSLTNTDILVFKIEDTTITKELNKDYGSYDYEALGIKSYNQLHCQMNRIRKNTPSGNTFSSSLYEKYVLPAITKLDRLVDFGAGKLDYVNKLIESDYKAYGYEPNTQRIGTNNININAVVNQIEQLEKDIAINGLFDKVVLDSVLNSVVSLEYEHNVLLSCNALCKDNGCLYISTRNIEAPMTKYNFKSTVSKERLVEFFDKDGFSASFRSGVWTLQRFHSVESLRKVLNKYFRDIKVYRESSVISLYAICKDPIRFSESDYRQALDKEFNMEYPNNFKHNKSNGIIDNIIKCIKL